MSTAAEKAKELVDRYVPFTPAEEEPEYLYAKQCALICVDEIIESYSKYSGMHDQEFFNSEITFWQEVKNQINLL